jgi:hypothetical protein
VYKVLCCESGLGRKLLFRDKKQKQAIEYFDECLYKIREAIAVTNSLNTWNSCSNNQEDEPEAVGLETGNGKRNVKRASVAHNIGSSKKKIMEINETEFDQNKTDSLDDSK